MARTWNDALPEFVRRALVKVKLIDLDGTGPDYDQWDGYPAERREVLGVARRPAGREHRRPERRRPRRARRRSSPRSRRMPPVAVEFVNTSLTSQNLDDKMGWAPRTDSLAIEAALLAGMPHLRYVDLDSHGYSIVDLDRDRLRFEWWTVDGLDQRVPGQALAGSMAVRHGEASARRGRGARRPIPAWLRVPVA